jgi:hypothetical protein
VKTSATAFCPIHYHRQDVYRARFEGLVQNRNNCPILILLVAMDVAWAWRSRIKSFLCTDNPFKKNVNGESLILSHVTLCRKNALAQTKWLYFLYVLSLVAKLCDTLTFILFSSF